MSEGTDKQLRDMEERSEQVERDIEEVERDWEAKQRDLPSADEDDIASPDEPLDEDNPVGGV